MKDPVQRFWGHVVRDPDSECWLWLGVTARGYGQFKFDGRAVAAHRFAYTRYVGPIPHGLELDHLCRVRSCVNPAHLEPVTSSTNKRRSPLVGGGRRRRGNACRNGHDVRAAGVNARGRCRVCQREAQRRYERRKAVMS